MNLENLYRRIRGRFKQVFYGPQERRHALSGDPDYWKKNRNFQFNLLLKLGLQPHHRFLDFGCGTLVGGIPLIDYLQTGCYYGVDIRQEVIEEGRKEVREHQLENKQPNLFACDSIKHLSIIEKFDYGLSFFVLGLLNKQQLKDLFHFLSEHLEADGAYYANIRTDTKNSDIKWCGFMLKVQPTSLYKSLSAETGLKLEDIGSLGDHNFNLAYNLKATQSNRLLKFSLL